MHLTRLSALAFCFAFPPGAVNAAQCNARGHQLKEPLLCSHSVSFEGQCGKKVYDFPQWDDVAVAFGAWEEVPIRIMAVSADALIMNERTPAWGAMFAGNSYNDDA